jgi:hypothetical protein
MKKFPLYVILKSNDSKYISAFRHITDEKGTYYRDAGRWSFKAEYVDDKLTVVECSGNELLIGKEVFECDKSFWKKDNGKYAEGL